MVDSFVTAAEKAGMPPGSLIHVGVVHHPDTRMVLTRYNREFIEEKEISSIKDVPEEVAGSDVTSWLVIEGLADTELVEQLGQRFGVHKLVLEDILNTHQRPKFEDYEDYLYIVLKGLSVGSDSTDVSYEQISVLLFRKMVIVFKEKADDLFVPVFRRLNKSKGVIRGAGADYLTYAVLDSVVDQYFNIMDILDEAVTPLEDRLLASEINRDVLATIQCLKREVVHIRRYVSPVREVLSEMMHGESDLVQGKTYIYLRDVSDHVTRVVESVETHRDMLNGLLEIYVSGASNRMNEIMKVLTMFASIFIPLTFIAGVYGMNFHYMPELAWRWAYPALWAIFIVISLALMVYFRKKKWL